MKAVAALRNQFGGHAVKKELTRPVYVRRLELVDFRSYAAGRGRLRAGAERARRPQRRGQDQPGRGAGLRGDARQPPGRHRRAAGPGRRDRARSSAARSCTTAGNCWSSWRSCPARPTGPGWAARRPAGPATCSARCGWCCSPRRIWHWSGATRPNAAATSTTCWSPRQPRYAGVRADYERVLKQRNALLRTAYLARKAGGVGGRRICPPWTSGTRTWPGTAPSCSPAGWSWCAALGPHVAKAYDAVAAGRARRRGIALHAPPGATCRAADRPGGLEAALRDALAERPSRPRWSAA